MNKVILTGRLTRNPDTRYGGENSSTAISRFTLAVDDRNETDFINCKALGKLGEWAERWLAKGSKVELVGKIKTGKYTKDGKDVYYTEVLATELNFGESKAEKEARNGATPEPAPSDGFMHIPDGDYDGLPFD